MQGAIMLQARTERTLFSCCVPCASACDRVFRERSSRSCLPSQRYAQGDGRLCREGRVHAMDAGKRDGLASPATTNAKRALGGNHEALVDRTVVVDRPT